MMKPIFKNRLILNQEKKQPLLESGEIRHLDADYLSCQKFQEPVMSRTSIA